ncbi:uncharacterized protein I303_101702 [Kwoniella dejecticola CBS 10117]|uniref:Uncharacterized protein n=1 Tax=Kwoniella dejecticola CBS 10117 TaxID=1296121 RepID=A0AAJ8KIR1_9TREE
MDAFTAIFNNVASFAAQTSEVPRDSENHPSGPNVQCVIA